MRKFSFFIIFAFHFFLSSIAFSQKVYLSVIADDPIIFKKNPIVKVHPDSLSATNELNNFIKKLHNASYLSAAVDTIAFSEDTIKAMVFVGISYNWAHLKSGNLSGELRHQAGFRQHRYVGERFHFRQVVELKEKVLSISQNRGYPFASIKLDSISISNNEVSAVINFQPGPMITFDSLKINGEVRVKKKFLCHYLKIYPGLPFNFERVAGIEKLINELPYVHCLRAPSVEFTSDKAIVTLYVEERKANQLDGIIGFLPNESNKKKLMLNGQINVKLFNLFNSGKNLEVEWNKMTQSSQVLKFGYTHPRLLGSNFDLNAGFNLFKQDTTFMNITRDLSLAHPLSKGKISFNTGLKTSTLLGGAELKDSLRILSYPDFSYFSYGAGYTWNSLDNYFYPRKGWMLKVNGFIGNKTIQKHQELSDEMYKDIQLKTKQLIFSFDVQRFYKLKKKGVLLSQLSAGKIYNSNDNLFYNDLFRIGGLKTLRGFNENYFYASDYITVTAEYRFFIDQTSYLLLFYNHGYIHNALRPEVTEDFPYGFGAGISFDSGPGIFNFVYSVGNSYDQKINLASSKIHFGIVSRF